MNSVRLNRYLANAGFDARRKIGNFLEQNNIQVNNIRITEPGVRINPETDVVLVNGKIIKPQGNNFVYYLLNKPKGVISSVSDEHGRKTVIDLIPTKNRIYPVGRLDAETTGALLLTNDGELTNRLTHPKYHINKTYLCLVPGKVSLSQKLQLEKGVALKDGLTAPSQVELIDEKNNRTTFKITIHEGKNHQVRRMLSKVGLELIELKRVSIGALEIGNLAYGSYRTLTESEIKQLKNQNQKSSEKV